MQKNTDQKNSKYRHFLRSVNFWTEAYVANLPKEKHFIIQYKYSLINITISYLIKSWKI